MKTKLIRALNTVLKQFPEYWEADKLRRTMVIEDIQNKKLELIKAFIQNEKIKSLYGTDIAGVLVFDFSGLISILKYKEYWADSFTKYRNKIGLTTDGRYLAYNSDVVLDFPYKDCVLEGGMSTEEQGKNEIYYNEIIAKDEIDRLFSPKALTNAKRFSRHGVQENITDFNNDDNLIIKGNNLIALHSLKECFAGKIKLVYIDPPYNTGNDSFKYNDNFNHSTWLTFMKNRLEVAKDLLKDDGVIFIQIDNKEQAYLKVLLDNIFGEKNYKNTIIVKKGMKSLQKQFKYIKRLNSGFDSILLITKKADIELPVLFKKLKQSTKSSWNNHWRGTDRPTMRYELFGITPNSGQWRWEINRSLIAKNNYEKLIKYIKENGLNSEDLSDDIIDQYYEKYFYDFKLKNSSEFELLRLSKHGKPEHYIPSQTKQLLSEDWMDLSVVGRSTDFEHEKNENILFRIIDWVTEKNDIVLDFHLGSGTTAAVAHKMERRYIGIEQMDYIAEITLPRLKKIIDGDQGGISKDVDWQGGGSFVYAELKKLNYEFADVIDAATTSDDLKIIYEEMRQKAHLNYQVELDGILNKAYEVDGVDHFLAFNELDLQEQKQLLIELLDKNQLYVNASEMEDKQLNFSMEEKAFTASFYKKD